MAELTTQRSSVPMTTSDGLLRPQPIVETTGADSGADVAMASVEVKKAAAPSREIATTPRNRKFVDFTIASPHTRDLPEDADSKIRLLRLWEKYHHYARKRKCTFMLSSLIFWSTLSVVRMAIVPLPSWERQFYNLRTGLLAPTIG